MQKGVMFWTGVIDPAREAISKEVFLLHRRVPRSFVLGLSAGNPKFVYSWRDRYLGFHPRHYLTFRLIAPILERCFALNHIFHSFGSGSWFFLRILGRRPTILTAALDGDPLPREMYQAVRVFVVESPKSYEKLIQSGIPPDRIRLIYPGVCLTKFQVKPPPAGKRFRLLFGSSPPSSQELDGRGVLLLLEAARALPQIEVVLVWRRWEGSHTIVEHLQAQAPDNVTILHEDIVDISRLYPDVHATAALFQDGVGKPCPNSIVESLACGRPVLVSNELGIAHLIGEQGCGITVRRSLSSVIQAIEELVKNYPSYQSQARPCAEHYFSQEHFLNAYLDLYQEVLRASR